MTSAPPIDFVDPVKGDLALIANNSIVNLDINATEYVPIIAAAGVFGVLVFVGAVAVLTFAVVLISGRKKFEEFPFFVIVWSLTLANAIYISMVICTIMPMMLIEADTDGIWYTGGAILLEAGEQGSLYFTLLMTVNRFVVFVFPSALFVFTRIKLMLMSMLIWFYVAFIVYWNLSFGIIRKFDRQKISMGDTILGDNILTSIFNLSSTILPLVMLAMYAIIFVVIKMRRTMNTNAKQQKKDRSLLWQALAVTIFLELSKLTSMVTPIISGATWVVWCWTIFNYSASIVNQVINPVMFLTTNKMVRGVLLRMFSKTAGGYTSESSSSPSGSRNSNKWMSRLRAVFSAATGTKTKDNTFVI